MKKILICVFCAIIASYITGCGTVSTTVVNESSSAVSESIKVRDKSSSIEETSSQETERIQSDTKSESKETASFDAEPIIEIARPPEINDGIRSFSSRLFQRCYEEKKGENALLSPLSAYMALAMVNNGAVGHTQYEICSVLSGYLQYPEEKDYSYFAELPPEDINDAMQKYVNETNKGSVLDIANAMFIIDRDDVKMNEDFGNIIQQKYGAELFHEVFSEKTVYNINAWASKNTHNMIPDLLSPDDVNQDTVSVLLNAVAFEGKWANEYKDDQIRKDDFHNYDKSTSKVDYLCSTESCYLENDKATGFVKAYQLDENDKRYSFAAILPNEDISIDDYIAGMGEGEITVLMDSRERCDVITKLPKFTFDGDYKLPNALKTLGMPSAFDPAVSDFSNLATTDDGYNLTISNVIQKTHIELDEKGTKAAAATAIIMEKNDAVMEVEEPKEVILNRPFVFVIFDEEEELPVFIGAVCAL